MTNDGGSPDLESIVCSFCVILFSSTQEDSSQANSSQDTAYFLYPEYSSREI